MKQATRHIIILTTLLLTLGMAEKLAAQHYIGVRGGYGIGSVRLYPKEETASLAGLLSGGVMWKHYTAERGVGGFEIDVLFMQQGYKKVGERVGGEYNSHIGSDDETAQYIRSVNSIMVPIFWQPHVYFFQRKLRVYMNLGVTFSYNHSSKYEVRTDDLVNYPDGVIVPKQKYNMQLTRDNPFGYGLAGGVGVSVLVKRWEVFVEARYYFGYGDILRNYNKYESNPLRSPMDIMEISAGVTYRLGKGDIKAKLGKKMQRDILEREKEIERKNEERFIAETQAAQSLKDGEDGETLKALDVDVDGSETTEKKEAPVTKEGDEKSDDNAEKKKETPVTKKATKRARKNSLL